MMSFLLGVAFVWVSPAMNLWLVFFFMYFFSNMPRGGSSVGYSLLIDHLSFFMILLSIWIVLASSVASGLMNKNYFFNNEFKFWLILLLSILSLTFSTDNIFLFYMMFEASLIPIFFLVLGWGNSVERVGAGMFMLFYTILASVPLMLYILSVASYTKTLSLTLLGFLAPWSGPIHLLPMLAFIVKLPIFFSHQWLPKAHVEAPVSGSMVLAGVLLKLGTYGLTRILCVIFLGHWGWSLIFSISTMGVALSGVICMAQLDLKVIIAYTSVGHMNLFLAGSVLSKDFSMWGGGAIMVGHGLISASLFYLVNLFYSQTHSRSLLFNMGVASLSTSISMFWFTLNVINCACPPFLGLVSEIMMSISMFYQFPWSALSISMLIFFSCWVSLMIFSILEVGTPTYYSHFSSVKFSDLLMISVFFFCILLLVFKLSLFS